MLTSKFLVIFLVYVFCDTVICGIFSGKNEDTENGNIQRQQALSGENLNTAPSILTQRLNQIHTARRRSIFLGPIKHVVGHIAEHLGYHRADTDFQERHFHPHHEHYLHHHNFRNDFPFNRDFHKHCKHPSSFPGTDSEENRFDFQPSNPETGFFHHHQYSNDRNNHDHSFHGENTHQTHGISEDEHNHHQFSDYGNNYEPTSHEENSHHTHGITDEKYNHHQNSHDRSNYDHGSHGENPHQTHVISEEKHNHHQIPFDGNHDHGSHVENPHQTHGKPDQKRNHHQVPIEENNHDHGSRDENPHPTDGISDEKHDHHQIPTEGNNHNLGANDEKPRQTHGESDREHNQPPTNLEPTTKLNKTTILYPPFEKDEGSKDDDDYPVSDFDKNKGSKSDNKPKVEQWDENESSHNASDVKNIGSSYPEWVHPQPDDVENMGSDEIPPWSKIDIRFRKN